MCLSKITRRNSKPTVRTRKAWKIVKRINNRLSCVFMTRDGANKWAFINADKDLEIPTGRWLKAVHNLIPAIRTRYLDDVHILTPEYMSGFHCFVDEDSAHKYLKHELIYINNFYVVVPVRVRGVRLYGEDSYATKVLVCDEIMYPVMEVSE